MYRSISKSVSALAILAAVGGCGFTGNDRASVRLTEYAYSAAEQIEQTYSSVAAIILDAYAALESDVLTTWGAEHMEMPSQKMFVHYDNGMSQRTVMDFEHGQLRIERVIEPGGDEAEAIESMRTAAWDATHDTLDDLAGKDQVIAAAERMAETNGMSISKMLKSAGGPRSDDLILDGRMGSEPMRTEPVLKNVVPENAADALNADTVTKTTIVGEDGRERTMLSFQVDFIPGFYGKLAKRYAGRVMDEARAHGVPPSIILAVMQTESAFNPRARSPIPAFGLMQIVPRSAGLDAYEYVAGRQRLLTAEELFEPSKNILLGVVYLKILDMRYLRQITDPQSRLYCVIAAYNTGAGNVARAFTGSRSVRAAAEVINRMTPDEVFAHLEANLPFEETRRYIVKVTEARANYRDWDPV